MQRNIPELVAQMTLEEKAGMCSGRDFWHLKSVERLGIPRVMVTDGPHGLRKQSDKADHLGINDSVQAVCFPAGCASASSFDEDLLENLGRALGRECRAENVAVLLGPAVNVKRSPLCGRNFEYYSEDPYLAGKLAAAQIRGVQSWQVGTSIKHFAANNQEFRRMSSSSNMDERTLREIYLPAFEEAVKAAQPWTVMCSYNKLNGVYASENPYLLTDILRGDWGFEGFVVSDWGAVSDRVAGVAAGLELEMPASGGVNDAKIVAAVKDGTLDEAVLDKAVARILNIIFRYADAEVPAAEFDREADHALAAGFEKECAVLLKNDGLLPLARTQKVAYIGEFAKTPRYQGGGSSHINSTRVPGALECAGGAAYAEGFPADRDEADEAKFAQAVAAARAAEVAVVFAGLPDSFESEGYDRTHMRLPACQDELIRRVCAAQKNTVVVLHCGAPVECPWADEAAAVLCMYLGGEGVGEAADALLYGEANPCGRLPESWPLRLEDNPSYLNFADDPNAVNYAEGVYVGYRYYDKKKMPVRWAFGHGESYTAFEYSAPRLSAASFTEGETVRLEVDVTNVGAVAGREVVQLYVADATGTPGRPEKELKGFAKVSLEPGETKTVAFALDKRSLAWYDPEMKDWYAATGSYRLLTAHSSRDLRGEVSVAYTAKKLPPLKVTLDTTVGDLLADARTAPAVEAMLARGLGLLGGEGDDSGVVNAEMARQMMQSAPLRLLQSMGGVSEEQLLAIAAQLNALAGG